MEFTHLRQFLENPASYPHQPARVVLYETHASLVAVASPFVFKIKKPVNYGFLDFSTLEKRRFYCDRELELNRRLAPDTYIDVLPIRAQDHQLSFSQEPPTVEYAVHMHELDQRDLLDQRLERDQVSSTDLARVAALLAKFYQSQQPAPELQVAGEIRHLKLSTDENFLQTKPFIGRAVSAESHACLEQFTDRFYQTNQDQFTSRTRQNRILDCHGDLHAEHIHIRNDTIQIYDCIEFNDRFRHIDVANDVAFLAMDLDYRGHPELALAFIHSITEQTRDPGIEPLLPFYKAYRAIVRAKVECLRADSTQDTAAQKTAFKAAARYFALALRYALFASQPTVLVCMGKIGSGKSTLAQELARELNWSVFSSDVIRKELAGLPPDQTPAPAQKLHLYNRFMTERTYQTLCERALSRVPQDQGAVLDATFSKRQDRQRLLAALARENIAVRFIEVTADPSRRLERLHQRATTQHTASDARAENLADLDNHFEPVTELPPSEHLSVSSGASIPATTAAALHSLSLSHPSPT